MKYKVFIPTSGVGSRLGDFTKYTNKSLVKIGKKPVISYIIERYPSDTEYVISLGYFGDHVKQFLEIAYPKRKFTFVTIDKYVGPGTSLGYSMLSCKHALQAPFIYNACDTITFDPIKEPSENWVSGYKTQNLGQYDSYNINGNNHIVSMNERGEIRSDFAYTGLIGINDYQIFWKKLEELYNNDEYNGRLSDFWCIKSLIETSNFSLKHQTLNTWYDIGNIDALNNARETFTDKFDILDKAKESIYIIDDKYVVKFFADETISQNRIKRAEILGNVAPKIVAKTKNFYKYEYVNGDLYADKANPNNFSNFLDWTKENLWAKEISHVQKESFQNLLKDFYIKKTNSRINDYLKVYGNDTSNIINGLLVPSINVLLDELVKHKKWLIDGLPGNFHGDFILDNIIKRDENDFTLIDWRQDFAGELEVGDIYYDLSKLNHNLVLNHEIINNELFQFSKIGNIVEVDIHRKNNLVESQILYHKWIVTNGYDLDKVKLLTAIIWLNMSPLHHKPFDQFLFYFGKYNLFNILKELKNEKDYR